MPIYIDVEEFRRAIKREMNPYGKPSLDYESGLRVLELLDRRKNCIEAIDVIKCTDCKFYVDKSFLGMTYCIRDSKITSANSNGFCKYGEVK